MGTPVIGRALPGFDELLGVTADRSWIPRGKCFQNENVPDFFPERKDKAATKEACEFCALCPVISECLQYAVTAVDIGRPDKHLSGVYGGQSPQQRAKARKARKNACAVQGNRGPGTGSSADTAPRLASQAPRTRPGS